MTVQSNILDPIHDTLAPEVWDDPESPQPKLKEPHRKWIRATVASVLAKHGYTHADRWLSLVLTGSLTTYQYGPESDCDVSLFVDAAVFPEWSRAEMIGLMVQHVDGTVLPGTRYPMQCYVVSKEITKQDLYKPGLRSGYDIETETWINPPERDRAHNVEQEENYAYVYALEQADKMDRLLRYEPDKAVLLWHQIHKRRMQDQRAGKGDFALSNIVYKFLANRGLFPALSQASGEYIAKTAGYEDTDYGYLDSDKMREKLQSMEVHEGTQGSGTVDLPHRPVIWDAHSNRVFVGPPGAVHQSLRDEFAGHFTPSEWSPDRPGWVEHGVITPNNEIGWYGSFPGEDSHGYDSYPEAAAIAAKLGVKPLRKDMPDVCPKCEGSGADYDASGGYYHDAQGRCPDCGGTGRVRQGEEEWHFGKLAPPPNPQQMPLGWPWGPGTTVRNAWGVQGEIKASKPESLQVYISWDGAPARWQSAQGLEPIDARRNFVDGIRPHAATPNPFKRQTYPDMRCPHCGAENTMKFDLLDQVLHCSHCGKLTQVGSDVGLAQHMDVVDYRSPEGFGGDWDPEMYDPGDHVIPSSLLPRQQLGPMRQGFRIDASAVDRARNQLGLKHPVKINLTGGAHGQYMGLKDGVHQIDTVSWLQPESASKQIWHELRHAKHAEEDPGFWDKMTDYHATREAGHDAYLAHPWEKEANELAESHPFMLVTAAGQREVAKFVYDAVDNRLLVGQMAGEEGEVESHADLAESYGIPLEHHPLYGQIDERGHVETFGRPMLNGFGQGPINQYEADWRLRKALQSALPGVQFSRSLDLVNPRWEENWTEPSVQFVADRPTFDASSAPAPEEGAWTFA